MKVREKFLNIMVMYYLNLINKDGALLFWEKAKKTGQGSKKLIQKISENRFIE